MENPIAALVTDVGKKYDVPEADLTDAYKLDRKTWPAKQELSYRLSIEHMHGWSQIAKALGCTPQTARRMASHHAWTNDLPLPGAIAVQQPSNVVHLRIPGTRTERVRPSVERARAQRQADTINEFWTKRGVTANARPVHSEEEGWRVQSDLVLASKKARA